MQSDIASEPVVATYRPDEQSLQSEEAVLPLSSKYLPGSQLVQSCEDSDDHFPAMHGMHVLPPTRSSVSVTLPAGQSTHGCVDIEEYMPLLHAKHTDLSMLGTLPTTHAVHSDAAGPLCFPPPHS